MSGPDILHQKEQDYLRYVEFNELLAQRRADVAPGIGAAATNICLSPFLLGIGEAAEPRRDSPAATYEAPGTAEIIDSSTFLAREIGAKAINAPLHIEPLGYAPLKRTDLELAA